MTGYATSITGHAAGVPFVAVPPTTGEHRSAPVVVAWHLMAPPRTEAAFAAALPLNGLDAWRIYLGLPMSGSRSLPGGHAELMRLGYEDAVLNLHGPVSRQAADEFAAAFASLQAQLDLGDGPLGVLGGSAGSLVAQLVLAESQHEVDAAVLISPVTQLQPTVEYMASQFGITYAWSDASREVARRLDFVARADELAEQRGQPAVLLIVGEDDDRQGFREPAELLRTTLAREYTDPQRAEVVTVAGMGHALAEEPGSDPAPQTEHAAQVDAHSVRWFQRHLIRSGPAPAI